MTKKEKELRKAIRMVAKELAEGLVENIIRKFDLKEKKNKSK